MSNSKYQEALDRVKEIYIYLCDEFNLKKSAVKMNDDIEVLQELVDKATPKNPILVTHGKVKMTAKEMFEELGFYATIYNDGEIIIWTNRDIDCKISFYEHDKEYGVFGYCYINLEIHNAITMQLKELGGI